MELTLENLVNEIVEQENRCYSIMNNVGKFLGEDSDDFKCWNAKWSVLYDLAVKFDFADKL